MSKSAKMPRTVSESAIHTGQVSSWLSFCPSMDLIAIRLSNGETSIFRLDGQLVFTIPQWQSSQGGRPFCWKPDGSLVATALQDGSIRLIGTDSAKTVHQLAKDNSLTGAQFLSWSCNTIFHGAVESAQLSGVDFLYDGSNTGEPLDPTSIVSNLPLDLSLLDVEPSLLKLAALPPGNKEDDIFSSRASLDTIFVNLSRSRVETADVLIAAASSGEFQVYIYETFQIGIFSLKQFEPLKSGCTINGHCYNAACSTHVLVARTKGQDTYLAPIDLRFLNHSGRPISLLASKSTQLQNVLRYIDQTQAVMVAEWRSSLELPRKYVGNVNEELMEKSGCDFVLAAYHMVVTGDCNPVVRSWLVEELTERNYKRWDKAVMTGYETLRRLAHQNLLPALERCEVLIVRLRGLAKYAPLSGQVEVSTTKLTALLDIVVCLKLITHVLLSYLSAELQLFTAFSEWLKLSIEQLSQESSTTHDNSHLDYNKILDYIQGPLGDSQVTRLLLQSGSDKTDQNASEFTPQTFQRRLRLYRKRLPLDGPLHTVPQLCQMLLERSEVIFAEIANVEKRSVHLSQPLKLVCLPGYSVADTVMVRKGDNQIVYALFASESADGMVYMSRSVLQLENGFSSWGDTLYEKFSLKGRKAHSVRFLDGQTVTAVCHDQDKTDLLAWTLASSENPHSQNHSFLEANDIQDLAKQDSVILTDKHFLFQHRLSNLVGDLGQITVQQPQPGKSLVAIEDRAGPGLTILAIKSGQGRAKSVASDSDDFEMLE